MLCLGCWQLLLSSGINNYSLGVGRGGSGNCWFAFGVVAGLWLTLRLAPATEAAAATTSVSVCFVAHVRDIARYRLLSMGGPWLLSVWMGRVYDSMFLVGVLTSLDHESLRGRLVRQTWEPVAMIRGSSVVPLVMSMSCFFLAPVVILVVVFHSGSSPRLAFGNGLVPAEGRKRTLSLSMQRVLRPRQCLRTFSFVFMFVVVRLAQHVSLSRTCMLLWLAIVGWDHCKNPT